MRLRQAPPHLLGDGALVLRVPVGVQQAHGHRLGVERLERGEVELLDDAVRPHPLAHAVRALERDERLGMLRAEPVEVRAGLAPEVQDVLEPRRRDERGASPLPLEQRVRGDRRAVREAVDALGADGARGRRDRLLLPARGRDLRRADLAVGEEDGVRERPADVDAEDPGHAAPTLTTMANVELELVGAGGEPVDFWRTVNAHGVTDLPPNRIDEDARTVELTLHPGPQTVVVREARPGYALVSGRAPSRVREGVRHVLRLDEDLSELYALLAADPDLAWAARGAGRLMRSETVFEDVIKTICTTNCAWSATVRMVTALVAELGEESDRGRRAFPTPAVMADAPEAFYREVVRAGYRGAYLRSLAALGRLRRARPRAAGPTTASSPTTRSSSGCSHSRASARTRRRT